MCIGNYEIKFESYVFKDLVTNGLQMLGCNRQWKIKRSSGILTILAAKLSKNMTNFFLISHASELQDNYYTIILCFERESIVDKLKRKKIVFDFVFLVCCHFCVSHVIFSWRHLAADRACSTAHACSNAVDLQGVVFSACHASCMQPCATAVHNCTWRTWLHTDFL